MSHPPTNRRLLALMIAALCTAAACTSGNDSEVAVPDGDPTVTTPSTSSVATPSTAAPQTSSASPTSAGSDDDAPFTMSVAQFSNGDAIPREMTCDGDNVSPNILLTAVPEGTRSYAVIVDDPDAPTEEPFAHWVLYGIYVTARDISDGRSGSIEGTNDFGQTGWLGPCPPIGDGPHTYRFRLFALSEDSADLPRGLDARALLASAGDMILEEVVATGTYER